jgi:hypothetical protein
MRREIEAALDNKRNIVPLMLDGFKFGAGEQLTGRLAELQQYNGLTVPEGYLPQAMEKLRNQFLNVAVDAVLHPASDSAQQVAIEQKGKAEAAILRDEQQKLPSPENSKDPLRAPTVLAEAPRILKALGVWLAGVAAVLTVVVTIVNQGGQLIDGVRKIFASVPEKSTAPFVQSKQDASRNLSKPEVSPSPRSPIEPPPISCAPVPPAVPGTNEPVIKPVPLANEPRSEIVTKIDILGPINNFHDDFAGIDIAWNNILSHWIDDVKTNRAGFRSIIGQMCQVLSRVSSKMRDLQDEYPEFRDIYSLLDHPKIGDTLKALDKLDVEIATLSDPPPPDFDHSLRPFVGTVTDEVGAMMTWFSNFEKQRDILLNQLKVRAQQ